MSSASRPGLGSTRPRAARRPLHPRPPAPRRPLGGRSLARPLLLDDGLLAVGLCACRGLLLGGLEAGLADLLRRLLPLGVGDGVIGDRGLAVAGLGLLELSLLHQVVLAAHGAGHFLGLARDAVEHPLAGLCCLVVVVVVAHDLPVPVSGRLTTLLPV